MTKKWIALLVAQFGIILCFTPYINKYDALGWLSFGLIIIAIPYTLYKALPYHQLSIIFAISTPVPLGFAWGYWLNCYKNYRLNTESIRTRGVVTATWIARTRHGGRENLFRIRFKTTSDYREVFSHKNEANYQVGDSVLVEYLPSEPNTYRILR